MIYAIYIFCKLQLFHERQSESGPRFTADIVSPAHVMIRIQPTNISACRLFETAFDTVQFCAHCIARFATR